MSDTILKSKKELKFYKGDKNKPYYEITYSFLDDLKFTLTAPLEIVDDLFKEDEDA